MKTDNTPIVLVHGLFGSLNAPEILGAFGDNRQTLAPDLIGYGKYKHADMSGLSLHDQAEHVLDFINQLGMPVHLVGHSVGGAVAALVATKDPLRLASFTSVEGNFTMKDAFWSQEISLKSNEEVAQIIAAYARDPDRWIAGAGVEINLFTSRLAREWLAHQPPSTIKAQAAAVVEATIRPEYLCSIEALMRSELPVNLIAGSKSAENWDTPAWANMLCNLRVNIPNVGHAMMAEDPNGFARAVLTCTNFSLR